MTEPVCVAQGLTVGYRSGRRRTAVLDGLDLTLHSGSFTCLLGPNGSGKSTLLRTLAGDAAPARRKADPVRGGHRPPAPPPAGGGAHRPGGGRGADRDRPRRARALSASGLGRAARRERRRGRAVGHRHHRTRPLAHRHVDELSDGERQRVMIARALVQEPAMLLLDEPTAYLDVAHRVELTALLRSLAAETGKAVLCTTHDLELALRAADRIWLVDRDGAVRVGAPEDLALDGSFSHTFASEGVDFDPDSGSLRMQRPARGLAHVEGEARSALWAARALERAGYAVTNGDGSGPAEVTVRCRTGPQWTLEVNGRHNDYYKLEDLVAGLPAPMSGRVP